MELPEDLVFQEILSRVLPRSLMRFKCVSKIWMNRISRDSLFIDTHLIQQTKTDPQLIFAGNRKIFNRSLNQMVMLLSDQKSKAATEIDTSYAYANETRESKISIVGSCNGLICLLESRPAEQVMLWNPATHQVRLLPRSLLAAGPLDLFPSARGLGFGFDIASKDYKVVQLNRRRRSADEGLFLSAQVFAKSGAVWRDCGVSGIAESPNIKCALAMEGVLYWVVRFLESPSRVVSFDLRDEVLRMDDAPIGNTVDTYVSLCRWRNSLAAIAYTKTEWRMWESTSSGGVRHWNKIMKFPMAIPETARWVWKEQFVVAHPIGRGYGKLVRVDSKAPHLETILELPDNCRFPHTDAFDYIQTIISVF